MLPIHLSARLVRLFFMLAVAAGGAVRADGAFPDEFSVHFPPNAPNRILLGANFGLLVSEDSGATWRYTCEPWVTVGSSDPLSPELVSFYQTTADGAVIASSVNLTRSPGDADIGCTWPKAGGAVAGKTVTDVFPSPTDPALVLAIVVTISGSSILASHDGGRTFDPTTLYSTAHLLTGIEIARAAPGVVYATEYHPPSDASRGSAVLLRTSDGFATTPVVRELPTFPPPPGETTPVIPQPRILAVDPEDPDTVYLRLLNGNRDSIGITVDGGKTVEIALTINGQFSSFLKAADRTLYAGMLEGQLYVRPPGGTFSSRPGPHLRCLGQKPGTSRIYACGDMFVDGFSLGYSDDAAQTFQPLMKFTEVKGLLSCAPVQTACAAHWQRIGCVLGVGTNCGSTGSDGGIQPGGTPARGTSGCATAGRVGLVALAIAALWLLRRSARANVCRSR